MLEADTMVQGRYRIIHQIRKGGMGTVYLARDENLGVTVALKQNFLDAPRLIEAFKREARLLAGLRHPALPQVKDYFINDGAQSLVMEYIAGDDLEAILDERREKIEPVGEPKPFEIGEVMLWAEQLLDALDYLHTLPDPVIHRDIKPQNLKLAGRNQIILLDFGLAKGKPVWMTRVPTTGSIYGYTPNYAPLEQIRGRGTDPRSDLYALGATLYHLITGVPPVDAATRADAFIGGEADPLPAANEMNPRVPRDIAALLTKSMEQHRNKRPASAAEMLRMLREAKHSTVIDLRAREERDQPRKSEIVALEKDTWPVTEIEMRSQPDEESERGTEAEVLRQEQERKASEEAEALRQREGREKQAEAETLLLQGAPLENSHEKRERVNEKQRRKKAFLGISIALALIGLIILAAVALSKKSLPQNQAQTGSSSSSLPTNPQAEEPEALKELMSSFVQIPAGEFVMGSNYREADESPAHNVRISTSFEIGKYEVTQAQWETLMGSNPSAFKGANLPVEQVSWNDAQEFIKKLNARNDRHTYRLPTEAEWEYTCRAGSAGDYAGNLDSMAWYVKNSDHRTHPVGEKHANAWGVYDMSGNVMEWVQDWYGRNYYSVPSRNDPQGPAEGNERVFRGGSWDYQAQYCRSQYRNRYSPDFRRYLLGFRLARTPR
jgi:formylglycine-generating enzyme required for sulfatase activity